MPKARHNPPEPRFPTLTTYLQTGENMRTPQVTSAYLGLESLVQNHGQFSVQLRCWLLAWNRCLVRLIVATRAVRGVLVSMEEAVFAWVRSSPR
jgi:hypothetical protein